MPNVDPNTGIWSMDIAKRRHRCDLLLAAGIGTLYDPCLTADVGCGDGKYCNILKAYGWKDVQCAGPHLC